MLPDVNMVRIDNIVGFHDGRPGDAKMPGQIPKRVAGAHNVEESAA